VINDLVTDQRVQRIAGTLDRHGFEVVLTGRIVKGSTSYNDPRFEIRRYNMLFRKGPLFYAFFNIRLFFRLMIIKRPSFFLAVDLDTLPANYLVSRLRSVPLLYDSHEYFTEVPELIGRPFVKKTWEQIERWIVPKLKHAITVSTSIAKAYKKKYGTEFTVVRNVPLLHEPVSEHEINHQYPSKYKIIYQGALNLGRGVELMISAMQYLEDTILIVAGDGDITDELHAMVAEMKLREKVIFHGRVVPEELYGITCQCNAGLSLEADMGLSYRYALPNKIFDYIQTRIPVICSDLPEMSALVNDFDVGIICGERDPREVADRIRTVIEGDKGHSPGNKKIDEAAKLLCWELEEEFFLRIVEKILDEV